MLCILVSLQDLCSINFSMKVTFLLQMLQSSTKLSDVSRRELLSIL